MQQIVILGAGYAGLLSALRLQPQIKKGKAEVTLVNASDTFTERIRLHQTAVGQTLKQINIPEFLKGTGIHFVQDFVRQIHPKENLVTLDDGVLEYDILMVALGSQVDRDAIEGIREHAFTLDRRSAIELNERLQVGGRLLVIGGGLTGIEAATEFAEREDVQVELVTGGLIGDDLSPAGREHFLKTLTNLGIKTHEQVRVNAIHEDHIESNQGEFTFDACLWAGGFKASPIVTDSGFAVNSQGQMLLRETLQSLEYDNVYGIGDSASIIMENGQPLRMACAVAMPMGCHGADNVSAMLNNQAVQPFRFAYALQCISLGRHNALVQMLQQDETPKDLIFTGRLGAFIKEVICRYTIFSLQLEKRLPGSYIYPKGVEATKQPIPVTQS